MADVPDITGIFAGLETRLATITGIRAYSEQPRDINLPAAWPDPMSLEIDYDLDMGGSIVMRLRVHLAVVAMAGGIVRAQQALLPYIATTGTYSIKAAIEGDLTLGGKVDTLKVEGVRDVDIYQLQGIDYFGCDVALTLWP